MNQLTELKQELKRYSDQARKRRDEVEPSKRMEDERLQTLRARAQAVAQQVSDLEREQRAALAVLEAPQAEYGEYRRAVAAGARKADAELSRRLVESVREAAPTNLDDPRLEAWYHTVELGNGLRSKGRFDLRAIVDQHGLPYSLAGKTALDVGTCDGFWAFEMERRGADEVVAIDVERYGDFDFVPEVRRAKAHQLDARMDHHFWLAHAMRDSHVERKVSSVYDLSPDTVGTFDVVFCGSLLMHLHNPLAALVKIRSVTREVAVVATLLSEKAERIAPDAPMMSFGNRDPDLHIEVTRTLGASVVYWHMNTRGLREMMEYAGFARTEPLGPVALAPSNIVCTVVRGYPPSADQDG